MADEPKAVTPQQSLAATPADAKADEFESAPASTDAPAAEAIAATPENPPAEALANTREKISLPRRSRSVAHSTAALFVLLLIAYAVYDVTRPGFLKEPWEWLLFLAVYGLGVFLPVYKGIYWRVRHDRDRLGPRIAHWVAAAMALALGGLLLVRGDGPIDQTLLFCLFSYLAFYWAVRGVAWIVERLFSGSSTARHAT